MISKIKNRLIRKVNPYGLLLSFDCYVAYYVNEAAKKFFKIDATDPDWCEQVRRRAYWQDEAV